VQPSQAEITQIDQQQYLIAGTVDFSTAPQLVNSALVFFKSRQPSTDTVVIDMSKIDDCNSAGLAMMFEMVKDAKDKNTTVRFINLPATLLTIAKAYGVESEIRDISQ
jgi:ABC-type transporter Mla MlaB component